MTRRWTTSSVCILVRTYVSAFFLWFHTQDVSLRYISSWCVVSFQFIFLPSFIHCTFSSMLPYFLFFLFQWHLSLLFFTLYFLFFILYCLSSVAPYFLFFILMLHIALFLPLFLFLTHTDILPRIRKKYPDISVIEFTQRQGDTVFIPGAVQIDFTLLYSTLLYSTLLYSTLFFSCLQHCAVV